ncbi:MAG: 3-methyl-2-oxobutanoate hydroxymethyltransferase [Pseudomonadota bacterium]
MYGHSHFSKRKGVPDFSLSKGGRPLVCLSLSTVPMARLADPHCDLILVGDSLGMVVYGMQDTLSVSLQMLSSHGRAVVQATQKALIVIDMPFGSFEVSKEEAFKNAAHLLRETSAQAVKVEGGVEIADHIRFMVERGIPVMGHIGLMPQRKNSLGGFKIQGKSTAAQKLIFDDMEAISGAGCFSIVIESVLEEIADQLTRLCPVPTIGIGASNMCDGQILVAADMLGLEAQTPPRFVKQYCTLHEEIDKAFSAYADEVKCRDFPTLKHTRSSKHTLK